MRINQYLARAGVSSRRKAEDLVRAGKVSVNGELTTELTTNINPESDVVSVEKKVVSLPELKYFMLNKPTGYTVTKNDPHAEKVVYELLPDVVGLVSIGRLDRDTSGLLLFTNDGDFAQRVIHPSQKIEKEYEVGLKDEMKKAEMGELTAGISLDDGPAKFISVKMISENMLLVVIEEGRNRIVRRMFEHFGNTVVTLKRTRIGRLVLDVPVGKYRELTDTEVKYYA